MATLMEGGIPERTPYSLRAPQAFWDGLDAELGRPAAEAYLRRLASEAAATRR